MCELGRLWSDYFVIVGLTVGSYQSNGYTAVYVREKLKCG